MAEKISETFSFDPLILIPVFNESAVFGKVLAEVRAAGFQKILVVDDGSRDGSDEIARAAGVRVLRHPINRGKGAALQTGFAWARAAGEKCVVILDGDGQMDPRDIPAVAGPVCRGEADAALGSRFLKKNAVPTGRRIANAVGNLVTAVLFGIWVTDSQSGFRAFSARALREMTLTADDFAIETEICRELRLRGLRFVEVPIHVRYTGHSMSKGQSFATGIKMLGRLILRSFLGRI